MRKYAFLALLFAASLFTIEASAQCSGTFTVSNQSGDDWILSIHNVDIPIQAGFVGPVPYIGGIPSASVGAFLNPSAACGSKFLQVAEIIPTPCAPSTNVIFYIKNNIDINGCVTDANVAFF